jgi:tRNA nucleotidyltransferase (CCA-adding enzyme)
MDTEAGIKDLLARGLAATPALARVREAAGDPVYLVGGSVRDILLGRDRDDLDVVVEGDAVALARELGGQELSAGRFATASAVIDGVRVDLAGARRETYPAPGALPEVEPASLAEDLARRDFTINAMAVPLGGDPDLIDAHGGEQDLRSGVLRILHERSFTDDPTRALRAARYAARLGFGLDPDTERLLRQADLESISQDRVQAELRRIAAEQDPRSAIELAAGWGLVDLPAEAAELVGRVAELTVSPPWSELAPRTEAVLAALEGPAPAVRELAGTVPASPSEALPLVAGRGGAELALARALGAEWLDRYASEWRHVRLEIDGDDLLAEGVPEGPAVGRGLGAALAAKLDGQLAGREAELEAALRAARETG